MPHERYVLKGPNGCTLKGPSEHTGETRYSWLEKKPSKPTTLYVRIEKDPGADRDPHSPIITFTFIKQNLVLSGGGFSPYRNQLQGFPHVLIPVSILGKGVCTIDTETNFRGDFLTIAFKNKMIFINIWAVGLLHGLQSVSLTGPVMFGGAVIGHLPLVKAGALPFFEVVQGKVATMYERRSSFEKRSYVKVHRLLDEKANNTLYTKTDVFFHIDWDVSDDRQAGEYDDRKKKGIADAKVAFKKLYGS